MLKVGFLRRAKKTGAFWLLHVWNQKPVKPQAWLFPKTCLTQDHIFRALPITSALQKQAVQSSIHYCVLNIQRQPTVVLLLLLLQYQKAYVIIHQDDFSLHFIYSTFVRNVALQSNTYIHIGIWYKDIIYILHFTIYVYFLNWLVNVYT